MKKWSPKLESMRKIEQDKSCSKFLTLVKKSTQKSTVNGVGLRLEVNSVGLQLEVNNTVF